MKPFSPIYYLKQNKSRSLICILMIVLTAGLFLLGNFFESCPQSYKKEFEYGDKLISVSRTSTGEQDYLDFLEIVKEDPKIKYVERTGVGYAGLQHKTALGLEMGGNSYVFNSQSDMQRIFLHLGIDCDYSNVKDGSIIMSETLAKSLSIKLGDRIDHSFNDSLNGTFSVDALINDNSYTCFYLIEDNENLVRMYIYSDEMTGEELYNYVKLLADNRNVLISQPLIDIVTPQFQMFDIIFYLIVILVAVIMAVTVNSVLTGQYLKREYEFGVYRALGKSKLNVFGKCALEIICMDIVGSLIGLVTCFLVTYILKGLLYDPQGILLLFFSQMGFWGYLLCNILIIVPVILINGRTCIKADITKF